MAVMVEGREIVLTGTAGNFMWDDGYSYGDVVFALASIGRDEDILVRINSPGGVASEGAAIHAALVAHKGRKTIQIEGVAASAASLIAMAGDEIVMTPGSTMMIHDPSGLTIGTVADHELQIRSLTALANSVAGIYADRTGRTVQEARADMQAETWLDPEGAVAARYADRVGAVATNENGAPELVDVEPAADPIEPAAFNYRLYRHPPERLLALADRNGWTNRPLVMAAPTVQPPRRQETSMANQQAGNGPAPAQQNGNVVQLDAARSEGRTEGRTQALAYVKQVRDVCALAGMSALADEFIASDTSVEAVTKALMDKRVEADRASSVSGQHAVATGSTAPKPGTGAASMKKLLKLEA